MFDIGSTELLLIVIVAILVIGPKDLPRALYKVGQIVGKARGMARHFRTGIDAMVREVELQELEKKWAEQNRRIMQEHPPETVPTMTGEETMAVGDADGGGWHDRNQGDASVSQSPPDLSDMPMTPLSQASADGPPVASNSPEAPETETLAPNTSTPKTGEAA
ncbi:Sec-independent protein translocase protein TatB [Sphingobium algorifonticola]|uniref:Twin-arginine translocase subunit TatB n=1 Tax=Sphingobium algorifonticola TaxID=2008318 RepID=A0A437J9Q2_9SPHN|nr:Sec-independent protein translocase protein TatB [Sphingobium algorifonticola]RVT42032.1 twin-arginine translocase subunit TatB [Sphingobium algorifonticola]